MIGTMGACVCQYKNTDLSKNAAINEEGSESYLTYVLTAPKFLQYLVNTLIGKIEGVYYMGLLLYCKASLLSQSYDIDLTLQCELKNQWECL